MIETEFIVGALVAQSGYKAAEAYNRGLQSEIVWEESILYSTCHGRWEHMTSVS